MNWKVSLKLIVLLALFSACKPNEPIINNTQSSDFTKGNVAFYGDIRNTNTHVLSLDLYTAKLSLDSTGTSYVGLGNNLYFDDIYIGTTEHTLTSGTYCADSSGLPFTFISGKNNDGISSGAYLTSVNGMQISTEYLTLGKFEVSVAGDSTIIDFDLTTESKMQFKAQFRGVLGWYDILPKLVKGRQENIGKRYTDEANNHLVHLASVGIDFAENNLPTSGAEIIIEFNTDTLQQEGIAQGRYTVAKLPDSIDDLESFKQNTITPFFTIIDTENKEHMMGSWYTSYTKQFATAITTGYANVVMEGEQYRIDYSFNSESENPITGQYVGPIQMIDSEMSARTFTARKENLTSQSISRSEVPSKFLRKIQ